MARTSSGAHYDRNHKYRGHWGLASNVSEEAAAIEDMPQSYNASVKWTATLTNRLLAQAGLGLYTQQYREIYREELPTEPGVTFHSFPNGALYDPYYTNFDVTTNLVRGAFRGRNVFHISGVKNYIANLSYVTGSHTLKGGMQLQQGISREADQQRGDIEVRFSNGAPNQAVLRATPQNAVEEITDLGLFIDEKWSLGHFTLSGGLRYDYFNGVAPDQWSPAGTWVPARLTTRVENIPNWRDINPRLGVAWDMFGNARTALKFTTGRFVDQAVAAPTRALNPMRQISATDTRSWTNDANGNRVPELNELGPTSNSRFGTVVQSVRFDPAYVDGFAARPGHWNYHVSLQHELRPGLGISGTYNFVKLFNTLLPATRAAAGFGRGPDNLRWGQGDFDEFTIVVPDDPRLPAEIRNTTITRPVRDQGCLTPQRRRLSNLFEKLRRLQGNLHRLRRQHELADGQRRDARRRDDLWQLPHQRLLRRRRPDAAAVLRSQRRSELRAGARRAAGQAARRVSDLRRLAVERQLPDRPRSGNHRSVDEHQRSTTPSGSPTARGRASGRRRASRYS